MFKKLKNNPIVVRLLSFLAATYMWIVFKTGRWTLHGMHIPENYIKEGKPFVVCFWHECLFMVIFGWHPFKQPPFHMMISEHADGQLIAKTVERFDVTWIKGSTARGGARALREALKCLRQKHVVGITPDGPRGPRHTISRGTVLLGKIGKVDFIPLAFSCSKHIRLTSWDQFIFPLPFSRGVVAWGEPVSFIGDESTVTEALHQSISSLMKQVHSLTNTTDTLEG